MKNKLKKKSFFETFVNKKGIRRTSEERLSSENWKSATRYEAPVIVMQADFKISLLFLELFSRCHGDHWYSIIV